MNSPAIFGKSFNDGAIPVVQLVFDKLSANSKTVFVNANFRPYLERRITLPENIEFYASFEELSASGAELLISLGGDGTILEAVTYVRDSGIPIMGVNLGRLGFLSNVPREAIEEALEQIFTADYSIQSRTLLSLESPSDLFEGLNFCLNELTVHKKDSSSMITINTYVGDEYLNSYWADGLIVATPTGSTAYSLSCGGPILAPNSKNVVITPIAPHNLNVRPIVLSDDTTLKLEVEGRSNEYLVSLDSRSATINAGTPLIIKRCSFMINLIELESQSFFKTIRHKLLWGIDNRN